MTGVRRRLAGAILATAATILLPAVALAHPLGNFTINHFAALRVAPNQIDLDVVIDRAEIPAFQEQQRLDADGNGSLSAAELEAERTIACTTLAGSLALSVGGDRVQPSLVGAGLSTAPGAGGLPTMRLVCEYRAVLATPVSIATTIAFEDRSFAERIGWREIVVLGDGTTVTGGEPESGLDGTGVSGRLTAYPTDLLAQPLDQRSVSIVVVPGGATLPTWTATDAQPIADADGTGGTGGSGSGAPQGAGGASGLGAVPGGVAEDLASLIDVTDLTPLAILASLAVAFGLGIVHALSPGHGKTIMAAYLVGGRGSSRQAVGLGLAVTVSHTLGVLALAGLTLAASTLLPPERLYPILGVASGALVIVIGASLLWSRLRVLPLFAGKPRPHTHAHSTGHAHGEPAHGHSHDAPAHAAHAAHAEPGAAGHGHSHGHGEHGHSHAPADGAISWRGLIALGLSGGLVPSASALILLLGSIAAGRVAYGLVLVLGFGLGMAFVLAGIGLLLIHARRFVERRPSTASLGRFVPPIQLATAAVVVVLGVVLTGQALTQVL